jgi:alkylhydroperoxidase/carboxymuconolactone decarboxylase family protein YurZ
MTDFQEALRRLALHDEAYLDRLLADESVNLAASQLDAKTHALVSVAALVAVGAASASYLDAVAAASRASADAGEIVGCLIAVLPVVGIARVVAAAPSIGLALEYDVEDDLERPGRRSEHG